MEKTTEYIIAKQLVDLYLGLKPSQMTDNERNIRDILDELKDRCDEYGPSGRNPDEIEFFRKLIKRHEKVFWDSTSAHKKCKEPKPKPTFRINDYSIENQVLFWKAFIENLYTEGSIENSGMIMPNRKSTYIFNKKTDIDQNYDFVMQILKDLKPDTNYPNLNYNEHFPAKGLYYKYRKEIVKKSKECAKKYHEGLIVNDKAIFKDNYIQKLWNSRDDIHDYSIIYVFSLLDLYLDLKETFLSDVLVDFEFGIAQKKYHVRWDLWIYVIMQNFQYLFKHGFINKDDSQSIANGIQKIRAAINEEVNSEAAIKGEKNFVNSSNIVDAYFDYNHLLKIRTVLLEEIEFGGIKPNEHIYIKSEDLFLEENDVYANYSDQKLFDKFHSGSNKVCDIKTFKRRLEFCKKFAEKYNELSGRNLNLNSNKVSRAVYRALYINPCKYDRMSSATMARKILEGDEKVLSKHYLLGMSISREHQLEEPNGKEFEEEKIKFMKELYELALIIINKSLPSVSAPEECLNEAIDCLDETMKKIVKVLHAQIK